MSERFRYFGDHLPIYADYHDKSEDFPREAPILIITDGYCDKVILHGQEHAFLVPQGAKLPFVPKEKVFRMR